MNIDLPRFEPLSNLICMTHSEVQTPFCENKIEWERGDVEISIIAIWLWHVQTILIRCQLSKKEEVMQVTQK